MKIKNKIFSVKWFPVSKKAVFVGWIRKNTDKKGEIL